MTPRHIQLTTAELSGPALIDRALDAAIWNRGDLASASGITGARIDDPSLIDSNAATAPLFAVARKHQPNSAPRFLRYVDRRPCWTADSAKADRMTHAEAERLADDWNEHAASKGFARRAYAHQIEADQ
jgi:hypothetical protein